MPALINIWGHLILGIVLAHYARRSLLNSSSPLTPVLIYLLAFQVIFTIPICAYLGHFFPHWTLLYFFDPQIFSYLYQFPGTLAFFLVALNTCTALAGFFLYRHGLKTQQKLFWLLPSLALGTCVLLILIQYPHRVFFIATHNAYWQGNSYFVLTHPSGWLGLLMLGTGLGLIVWLKKKYRLRRT